VPYQLRLKAKTCLATAAEALLRCV